ncbi:Transmembrane_domain-containing protein [Hexamita inflata]|uniref:Transmembrane domain-containing protein n=1 Tax=Hexamita inflata TaxID=28002 RepID=A0AA86PYC0_9EUKA|nr:Transmembrane domain-containing protein [Hexamita inflata]
MNFVSEFTKMNLCIVVALCFSVLLSKFIQTRKLVHLLIGPIFMHFVDRFVNLSLSQKLLLSSVPLSSSILFYLSTVIKQLSFLKKIIAREQNAQLLGIICYGLFFTCYPFISTKYFKYSLVCLVFGDGVASFGAFFNKKNGKGNAGSLLCYLCSFIALVLYGAEVTEAGILGAVGAVLERVSGAYDNLVIVAGVWIVGEVMCRIK